MARDRIGQNKARFEYLVAGLIALAVALIELQTDFLLRLYLFARHYSDWYLDKVFLAAVAACIALAFLGIRRSFRLRSEVRRRVAAEEEALTLARHDPLTGLPNRRRFMEELTLDVQRSIFQRSTSAVLLVDLDRFKPINDLHGHAAGDMVLIEIADRLKKHVRTNDCLARIGGDEFAMIVPNYHDEDTPLRLAQRIISAITQPIQLRHVQVEVSVSVGIAISPNDSKEPNGLLQAADLAMYRAKQEGRGKYRFFEEGMDAELRARAVIEKELKTAISKEEIVPYYQPIVSLETKEIRGFEILARWVHPAKGLRQPIEFITVAEDTGQISSMSYGLLRQACRDSRGWPKDLSLSLNVSPCQLEEAEFPHEIMQVLREESFDPGRLIIEITEAALVKDMDTARTVMDTLKGQGVQIELDDFGVGYSSLYHLRELSFDAIKIDRSFVMSLSRDGQNRAILGAIVNLGNALNLSTIAEGIEDESDLKLLAGLGCRYGQGYYFGRPMPADDVGKIVREKSLTVSRP